MATNNWTFFPGDMFQFSAGHQSTGGQPGYTENPAVSLRRRAARVWRANSAGTSPHTIGRRKTTAVHGSARQRLALDGARHASEDNGLGVDKRSRPISWHPSSFVVSNHQSPVAVPRQDMNSSFHPPLETNFTTATVNGVVTPLAFPYPDEPLPKELFSTLDGYPGWAADNLFPGYPASNTFPSAASSIWPAPSLTTTTPPLDQFPSQEMVIDGRYPTNEFSPFRLTMPHFNVAQPPTATAPPTPDFLPIQTFSTETECRSFVKDESLKDELVGMGLYDAPDESPLADASLEEYLYLTRLDGGTGVPSRPFRKGLKLEETFNPATIEDDGDDEEEDDGDEDADYMSDESSPDAQRVEVVQQNRPSLSMAPPNLSNHTFFFENDGSLSHGSSFAPDFQPGLQGSTTSFAPYGWI